MGILETQNVLAKKEKKERRKVRLNLLLATRDETPGCIVSFKVLENRFILGRMLLVLLGIRPKTLKHSILK